MKLELEFKSTNDIPSKFKQSEYSDDLIVLDDKNNWYLAHYDFNDNIWEDLTTWSELYGHDKIENVLYWAEIKIKGAN